MRLTELLGQLTASAAVDGLAVLGSTATNSLRPVSDVDVLVVLSDDQPPVHVGVTNVEGRLTDLVFATTSDVDLLLAGAVPDPDSWLARVSGWVHDGQIVFDRSGRLERLRADPLAQSDERARHTKQYETWFSINYNLAQNRRLAPSGDEVDQIALELRLLYSVSEVVTGYFRLRGLPWPGEKAAVRHLAAHDPIFLADLRACLAATDHAVRLLLYEKLAKRALEPFGGVWLSNETWFQFRPGTNVDHDLVGRTAEFWRGVVGG